MHLSTFIHQKSYERVVHKVRRHFITLIPAGALFVILLGMPVVVWLLIGRLFPDFIPNAVLTPLIILAASVYYLSVTLFFYSYFLDFYLDVLVVTNDRLIDIEQIGLLARSVSEVDLYKIQDVTSEVRGALASLFNYGTISIQSAGAVEKFIIHDIPGPEKLRQEILDLAEADRQYHGKNL